MYGLQVCLFKYITVAAICIYLRVVKMPLKGEVGCHALKGHGNYIVDHGKSWKSHGIVFLEFLWETCESEIMQCNKIDKPIMVFRFWETL